MLASMYWSNTVSGCRTKVRTYVLYTCAVVEVNVFFDLTLLLAVRWFIDGHLDHVIRTRHNYRFESGELRAYVLVVYRPETMEAKATLVPVASCFHLGPVLVAHAVIYGL